MALPRRTTNTPSVAKTLRADPRLLRSLVPLCELTEDNFAEVASKAWIEELGPGRPLFRKGDKDNKTVYLLSGTVVLSRDDAPALTIAAGSKAARHPLDAHQPRQATAIAQTPVTLVRIDNNLLDVLLTWDQNAGYVVTEVDAETAGKDSDWMVRVLRSRIFHRIPPTNIQAMFLRMEAKTFKAGDVVVKQGEEGDFYYHIRRGRCVVTRRGENGPVKVAELREGDSFGEEALVSSGKRNASVIMATEGVLMRLAKADFEELLKQPVLRTVSFDQVGQLVHQGAKLLDVRLPEEHKNGHIKGSLHVPLPKLRAAAEALPRDRRYVVYCDSGSRSASAAFLLLERGFEVFVLDGGLMALSSAKAASAR